MSKINVDYLEKKYVNSLSIFVVKQSCFLSLCYSTHVYSNLFSKTTFYFELKLTGIQYARNDIDQPIYIVIISIFSFIIFLSFSTFQFLIFFFS